MIDSLLSLWYNKTTLKKGGCRMIKKFIVSLSSIIGISCIVYYTSKYYIERQLCFTDNMLIPWSIISSCIIVAYDSGELSLLIESGLKKYKVIVDELECLMKIYRCDVHVNFGKHTKENLVLKKTFNDDCIWNSIKWIAKDSKL